MKKNPFYQAHGHCIQQFYQLPKGPLQQGEPVAISNISLLFDGVTTSEEFAYVKLKGYNMPCVGLFRNSDIV